MKLKQLLKLIDNWGKDYVRVLCTTPKCAHEWDVHKSRILYPSENNHMQCDWCGGWGKCI